MSEKSSSWNKLLTGVGYFFGSFFVGATSILVIEELGDWYEKSLNNPPLWRWWLTALITGVIVVGVFKFIVKVATDEDGSRR